MKLRYTGTTALSLVALGISLEPGEEIERPGEVLAPYAARPDFERLDTPSSEASEETQPDAEQSTQAAPKRKTKAANDAADANPDATASTAQ